MMQIAVAITGASGVILGTRLIDELVKSSHTIFSIISDNARAVIAHEIDAKYTTPDSVIAYSEHDAESPLNSSSCLIDAMIVVPCSLKTLSAIANGYANNLIVRAAENTLRTNGRLVVVPRETPLSASALENMLRLRKDGAIILPPVIGFYHHPKQISDIVDFMVGKMLDAIGVTHSLYQRWGQ
ncbi:UbiX family flavin prenyltransferase [candidate division KSB1 bacterium]|nr:UbiX family flavin prenyltransferase [candidate division KSB1 bacterium]